MKNIQTTKTLNSRTNKPKLLSLSIASILSTALCATNLLPANVYAAEQRINANQYNVSISAGKLSDALAEFAANVGVSLSFEPKMLADINSQGLQGIYTVKSGFSSLLANTNYELVSKGESNGTSKNKSSYSIQKIKKIETLPKTTINDEETALQQRQKSSNSKIFVDQAQIKRFNDVTTGDVLRRLPGVLFGGSPGENKDVNIRGLDKEYTQVLINGRRIPGGGKDRQFEVDQIPAQLIERIEIIRAPTADIDAQGIAGTINIILKKAPTTPLLTVTAGVSKLQDGKTNPNLNVTYGGQKEDVGYLLNFNVQQRQYLEADEAYSFNTDGSVDESEQKSDNKQYDELQFSSSINWEVNKNNQLLLEPLVLLSNENKTKKSQDFTSDGSSDGREVEDESKRRSNLALYGQWNHQYGTGNELTVGLNIQESNDAKKEFTTEYKADDSLDKTANKIEYKSDQETSLFIKNQSFIGEQHTLKAGIEFINKKRTQNITETETEDGETSNEGEDKDLYSTKEQRFNAYILDEYALSERQLLTAGIRFEWTETNITNTAETEISGKSTDTDLIPSLHYLFTWTENTSVRASITNTVRRPTFDDMVPYVVYEDGTLDKPDEAGNPDLLPETATGLDVGIEHYFAKQAGNIGLNVFYRDIDDKIETRVNFNSVAGRYEESSENIGEAALKGIEFDASLNMDNYGIQGLTLSTNAIFLDGEVTDQDTGLKAAFKEMPDYVYNIGFDHLIPAIDVSWGMNFNYISPRKTEEISDEKTSNEVMEKQQFLDMYIKKTFANGMELRFSAQNLLAIDTITDEKKVLNNDGTIDSFERNIEHSKRIMYLSVTGRW